MSNIYRFTGPPENWITAIGLNKWAFNDKNNNKNIWSKLKKGDIALLHSTASSDYSKNTASRVIGYGIISDSKWVKDGHWWIQEINNKINYWPYVIEFSEVYLFGNPTKIDFSEKINNKSIEKLKKEVEEISKLGLSVSQLNTIAKNFDTEITIPNFPVNGSASGVNSFYEDLILSQQEDYYSFTGNVDTSVLADRLDQTLDSEISKRSIDEVKNEAMLYKHTGTGYVEKNGMFKFRKDNEAQKRRIAFIEDYTCQVCNFYCEYIRKNGQKGWIIEVDHIVDKSSGGDESNDNLWVLCPNCHNKKTRGVINIDPLKKIVTLNGRHINIRDNHLSWG